MTNATTRLAPEKADFRPALSSRLLAGLSPERIMTKRTNGPSVAVKMRVMKRDRFQCTYCGAPGTEAELEVDHIIAVAKGGSHHMSNLTTACRACNQKKADGKLAKTPRRADAQLPTTEHPIHVHFPRIQCGLERVVVNFLTDHVELFLPDMECVDMTGAIDYALSLNPSVRRIYTYSGTRVDTAYARLANDQWEARPAPRIEGGG